MAGQPKHFIHPDPTPQTPIFGGEPIDMRRLSHEGEYDYSYLSKIFGGASMPGPTFAKRLAKDLGMTLPSFYAACESAHAARLDKQD